MKLTPVVTKYSKPRLLHKLSLPVLTFSIIILFSFFDNLFDEIKKYFQIKPNEVSFLVNIVLNIVIMAKNEVGLIDKIRLESKFSRF